MTHSNTGAAPLLLENLSLFNSPAQCWDILDLACGNGRNGLVLSNLGHAVIFADRDGEKLAALEQDRRFDPSLNKCWLIDLELPACDPLAGRRYDAVLVFNYLHRPLMPAIKAAVKPGGLLIYETFTEANKAFGRPNNPDFLLKPGELKSLCAGWEILQSFEGLLEEPARAVANVIARKPLSSDDTEQ